MTTGWGAPAAVKFNSLGQLHAVNQGNGEVVIIDRSTGNRDVLAVFPYGWSDNLAFDSNDRLFVSSATDGTVAEILPDRSIRIVSPGGMTVPMGIALIGDTVYVGEPQSFRGFDTHTGEAVSVNRSAFGLGPALVTTGISSVGDHLILLSFITGQVLFWDTSNDSVVAQTFFTAPVDAEPFGSDLLISDAGTGSVVRVNLSDLNDRETIASGFFVPSGLASPEGIALRSGGNNLLVVEGATSSLKEINLRSGKVKTIATGLGFQPAIIPALPAHWFNDVDIDSKGAMYVNSDGANVIYKLRSHGNAK